MSRGRARRQKRNRWIARSAKPSRAAPLAGTLNAAGLSGAGSLTAVRMFRVRLDVSTSSRAGVSGCGALTASVAAPHGLAGRRPQIAPLDHAPNDPPDEPWALITWGTTKLGSHSYTTEFRWFATEDAARAAAPSSGAPSTIIDTRIAGTRQHRVLLSDNDVKRIRRLPADSTLCSVRRDLGPTRFQV